MTGHLSYDYVIVGAGSAGCVMANRLSAGGRSQVCLLEAGPPDSSPLIHVPGGAIGLANSQTYNWRYWTVPQTQLDGRARYMPRGRTLGGSSSINLMVYIRGHARDYDQWAQLGNPGWSYADVLPHFRATENFEAGTGPDGALQPEFAEHHGVGGGLNVARNRETNPLSLAFLQAMREAGYAPTPDFNGAQQEGYGLYHVMQKGGQRCSNARAFLRAALDRPNLRLVTGARATRVLFEGRRAVGVRYYHNGLFHDVLARREVILTAGAIATPQLLLLSGIGPRDGIEPHGLSLVHELPGVGRNLQDHVYVGVSVRDRSRTALSLHPAALWRALVHLFKYAFFRTGMFASNVAEAGAFIKTAASEPIPDLQLHFVPLAYANHGLDLGSVRRYFAYTLYCYDCRPQSRGTVSLDGADPLRAPRIDPRFCEDPRDMDKLVAGIRLMRGILAQPAFASYAAEELGPGPDVQSDAQIAAWIRTKAETAYHPVGTCRMGTDPLAVVDARLRVRGLTGLRIADASIMPTLVGGNTNAPTTMIADKGAAMVLEDLVGLPLAVAA